MSWTHKLRQSLLPKNCSTFKIDHSLLSACVAVFRHWSHHIRRIPDTAHNFSHEKVLWIYLCFVYKYRFMYVFNTVKFYIKLSFKTISEKV